jgi:DUF971 family protein
MAGLSKDTPRPTEIKLRKQSQVLEVAFDNGSSFVLPCEFLRVHSPSAEVRGHGSGQEVLQVGKKGVLITEVNPVGHYAVQLTFSDGHSTGIYSWDYLYEIGRDQERLWQAYLRRLDGAGASREPVLAGAAAIPANQSPASEPHD